MERLINQGTEGLFGLLPKELQVKIRYLSTHNYVNFREYFELVGYLNAWQNLSEAFPISGTSDPFLEFDHSEKFIKMRVADLTEGLLAAGGWQNSTDSHDEDVLRYLIDMSVLSFATIMGAIRQSQRFGKRQVVYVSREGETLAWLHNLLLELDDWTEYAPEGRFLPTSRAALRQPINFSPNEFQNFVESLSISLDDCVISDLGWNGTICSSIEEISGLKIPSFYLMYRKKITLKTGSVLDLKKIKHRVKNHHFLGPIERAFTLGNHSVVSYADNGHGGTKALYSKKFDGPTQNRLRITQNFLEPIFKQVSIILMEKLKCTSEISELSSKVFADWLTAPTCAHASTWFDEKHDRDEESGRNTLDEIIRPNDKWLELSPMTALSFAARRSLWPHGYLQWREVVNYLNSHISKVKSA